MPKSKKQTKEDLVISIRSKAGKKPQGMSAKDKVSKSVQKLREKEFSKLGLAPNPLDKEGMRKRTKKMLDQAKGGKPVSGIYKKQK